MTAIARPVSSVPSRRLTLPIWIVPVGFGLLTIGLLVIGRAGIVRIGFPVGGTMIGLWLFGRGMAPYLAYTWALWEIAPGLRRIVDYQLGGLEPQNPMLLTPFLVSMIALVAVGRRLPSLVRANMAPWAVAAVSVVYGFVIGVLELGVRPATHALISWLVPLGLGLWVALEWRRYPEAARAYRGAFLWGAIVLGTYGILQFINPPIWDRLWMMDSGMYSIGRAFPYEVRVFSLVNAPLPFATVLVAGLFVALSIRGPVRVLALAVGTVALLLSLVRSVWLTGALGLLILMVSLPLRSLKRIALAGMVTAGVVLTAAIVAPRSVVDPTLQILSRRFATFSELGQDASLRARSKFLDDISTTVAENPIGRGLGSTGVSSTLADTGSGIRDFDNGLFAVWYSLGWFAGTALLLSAAIIVALPFFSPTGRSDPMTRVARAVAVTSLLLIVGANVMEGVSGAVLWGFAGLAAAGRRYHRDVELSR